MNARHAHPRLVVIGNGMAGMRTVEELLKLAPDMYRITVFGAEPHGNYNRIMLSPVLAGEKTVDDIMLNTREWYDANGITLHAGDPVVRIDRKKRVVHAASGLAVPYDRLLIATGSKPFIVPVPGHQLPGVIGFRDISDVDTMLAAASIVSTSLMSRKPITPGSWCPGTGTMNGFEPVAINRRSYGTARPEAACTTRFLRSMRTTGSPACRVMPLASYHSRVLSMMSSTVFSPASTGESMMRL